VKVLKALGGVRMRKEECGGGRGSGDAVKADRRWHGVERD